MPSIRHILNRWFRRPVSPAAPPDVEALRIAFQTRYHQFKLLLSANNKALEIMSEIQAALAGQTAFGMTFVRSRCTRLSATVFAIVRHLNELAPGQYTALFERFRQIETEINRYVAPPAAAWEGPLVLPLADVRPAQAHLVGAKMANLADLAKRLGLAPPGGFVVTAAGFARFMAHSDLQTEINRRLQAADVQRPDALYALSADVQQLIIRADVPGDLQAAIQEALDGMTPAGASPPALAVRSSALGEDAAGTSFAGQYRSQLNVSPEHLLQAYKEVVASKYGVTAMGYRLARGIRDEDVAMCVGCMPMIDAVAGGVVYTRNPLKPDEDEILIHSAWGLPKSVVDGGVAADRFVVRRHPEPVVVTERIGDKQMRFVRHSDEGLIRLETDPADRQRSSLRPEQVLALARLAAAVEADQEGPRDLEWALDPRGRIHLLQCRPLEPHPTPATSPGEVPVEAELLLRGGQTASAGAGAGPVFVVQRDADALAFPAGAVLVASQALPRWASLLDRAAAVVTEQGSIVGHLANVAREFGVPALMGLQGAVTALAGAGVVTVDADGQAVYGGRVASLLAAVPRAPHPMAGSPVYEALRQAADVIIPLNLLDPDAPAFDPRHCRTLHDITRFCHEKAVHEMFSFGKHHDFPERSSKQLFTRIPMQWWVLDLDDGLARQAPGPYARLEDIVSIPMLALWEGITAFAWEGPPPVDSRGMMAVMFEATTNRALVPTVRSRLANRNYFMISRHFCSLQSRLGFHFCTVEALVGERPGENYATFRFKGGAADESRRIQRVAFVGEILEVYGFSVSIRQDALAARIEDERPEPICRALKILGYLVIHTRQLDMVMASSGTVAHYRRKIDDQIRQLTGVQPSPAA